MELANKIVELFEDLLDEKGIEIPCEDEVEQKNRYEGGNDAKLYGMEYWNLLDQVENLLLNKEKQMFTTTEINKAKELAYINWDKNLNDEDQTIGFAFKGQWISNPFVESSGRFEFVNYEAMCEYYGEDNVIGFIKKILQQEKSMNESETEECHISGIIFEHGKDDFGLWEGFYLSEEDENAIWNILQKYDTQGCSVRGTRKEIAEEMMK